MTALIITASVIGYIVGALLTARIAYRMFDLEDDPFIVLIAMFWPLNALGYAAYRFVKMPSRKERGNLQRRQIADLERELGIGDDK